MEARGKVLTGLLVTLLGVVANANASQLEWRDAEDWILSLEKPERLAELRVEERLAHLELRPGQVVADIGAGTGVFSRAIARAVGPTGKVYAEDIQQRLVDYIGRRAKEANLENIVPVLGDYDDPNLPSNDIDVAWLHDVFHAVEDKRGLLQALVSRMKPESRIAITEWVKTDTAALKWHDDLEILLSEAEAKELLAEVGFYPVQEIEGFSLAGIRQWYIIFARGPREDR